MRQDWSQLYNTFKGEDWPPCPSEDQFHTLPDWIQQELIEVFGVDPYSNDLLDYKKFACNGPRPITVFYTENLDGGGTTYGKDYVAVIKKKYHNKKFTKVFEWCSGPGFIGYNLLSHKICDKLCLSDLYNPAIELAELTATYSENNCKDLVSAYLMKDLSLMPSHEMFDLVVANPPHVKTNVSILANTNRICTDLEWRAHKNFFQHIKSHLQPDAIVLLQENKDGSTVKDFEDMVKHAGLKITDCFNSAIDPFYYIEIQS